MDGAFPAAKASAVGEQCLRSWQEPVVAALPDLAGHCYDRWRRLVAVDFHYHMCVTSLQQWKFLSSVLLRRYICLPVPALLF